MAVPSLLLDFAIVLIVTALVPAPLRRLFAGREKPTESSTEPSR